MPYTHYFDARLSNQFDSDIEDFDEALQAFIKSFPDKASLRKFLTSSGDGDTTDAIVQSIIHSDTFKQ
jgi:hypothetical protein